MKALREEALHAPRRLASTWLSTFPAIATLLLLIVLSPAAYASAPSQALGAGTSEQRAAWQKASAEGAGLIATARTLDVYLVRHPDGTLSLNAPTAVVNKLPARFVGALTAGLKLLNARVVASELQTTSAGAVFRLNDDPLTFQGGWTGHGWAWWGQWTRYSSIGCVRIDIPPRKGR